LNDTSDDDRVLSLRAATEAKKKLAEIHTVLRSIAHELVGPRFWRYVQNISGGLQEYIEALSFVHYVEHGRLVSYEQVQAILCDDTGQHVGFMCAQMGACDVEAWS
jgi:predicted translin family RNA/ssDNA-binding protein